MELRNFHSALQRNFCFNHGFNTAFVLFQRFNIDLAQRDLDAERDDVIASFNRWEQYVTRRLLVLYIFTYRVSYEKKGVSTKNRALDFALVKIIRAVQK